MQTHTEFAPALRRAAKDANPNFAAHSSVPVGTVPSPGVPTHPQRTPVPMLRQPAALLPEVETSKAQKFWELLTHSASPGVLTSFGQQSRNQPLITFALSEIYAVKTIPQAPLAIQNRNPKIETAPHTRWTLGTLFRHQDWTSPGPLLSLRRVAMGWACDSLSVAGLNEFSRVITGFHAFGRIKNSAENSSKPVTPCCAPREASWTAAVLCRFSPSLPIDSTGCQTVPPSSDLAKLIAPVHNPTSYAPSALRGPNPAQIAPDMTQFHLTQAFQILSQSDLIRPNLSEQVFRRTIRPNLTHQCKRPNRIPLSNPVPTVLGIPNRTHYAPAMQSIRHGVLYSFALLIAFFSPILMAAPIPPSPELQRIVDATASATLERFAPEKLRIQPLFTSHRPCGACHEPSFQNIPVPSP
jgi:hypothetical protein